MLTLRNDFHGTEILTSKRAGDTVARSTVKKWKKCPMLRRVHMLGRWRAAWGQPRSGSVHGAAERKALGILHAARLPARRAGMIVPVSPCLLAGADRGNQAILDR